MTKSELNNKPFDYEKAILGVLRAISPLSAVEILKELQEHSAEPLSLVAVKSTLSDLAEAGAIELVPDQGLLKYEPAEEKLFYG